MLGQLLEVALVTDDTGGEWLRLQKLGFEPAAAGDVWPHAYGVVACEGLAIGLHARGDEAMTLVFVRHAVAALHRELTARGIEVEQARLGSDVFNELTLREPGGLALKVLEARSFSPPPRLPARTVAGVFRRLSLPCRDFEAASAFWSALGIECETQEEPFPGLVLGRLRLACHERRLFTGPLLVFESPAEDAGAMLAEAGFDRRPRLAGLAGVPHAVARGPEDLTLLMLQPG